MEPVYVRGGELKMPLLRKVLVTYGGTTAFEDTLDEALNKVFGAEGSTTPPPDKDSGTPPPSGNPTVQQALEDAQKAFEAGQKALNKSQPDWPAYGEAQKDLESALKKAEEAQSKTGGAGGKDGASSTPADGSPGDKPSASPSGSPGDGSKASGGG